MKKLCVVLLLAVALRASDAKTVLLWPGGAPGALGDDPTDNPSLTIYLPDPAKAVGAGVVICPGGGYVNLAMDHEGKQVAEWLNTQGMAAFVLKYRLGPRYHHPIELQDAQRAIRIVRSDAARFGVKPDRIGIWGFSAGGHLASTAATHFDSGDAGSIDPIDKVGSRPDFAILGYPVLSMHEPYVHAFSRKMLLGDNPDPKLVDLLSNELQVTAQTPPTFLFHTNDDNGVPPENSVLFYLALRKAHVPAEMHIFEHGAHGVGLAPKDPVLSIWPTLLANWFHTRGLL